MQALIDETRPELALADLGVEPELISAEERRCLDVDGFVILQDVISADQIDFVRGRIDEMLDAQRLDTATDVSVRRMAARRVELFERSFERFESESSGSDALLEDMGKSRPGFDEELAAAKHITEGLRTALAADDVPAMRALLAERRDDAEFVEDALFESDPAFDLILASPRVFSALAHVLGPMFHILNMVSRCPLPGQGQQALHRAECGPRRIATTIWLLDDMTLDNGPTRLVPGSHLSSQGLPLEMDGDPTRPHPEEIHIVGRAGSVLVFDDRCWHGGSRHHGGGPRRVVISSFTQRALYPSISLGHPQETLARLSPGQCWILHPKPESEE